MIDALKHFSKKVLPEWATLFIRKHRHLSSPNPSLGQVNFGNLRRVEPLSRSFGYDRGGTRIGRYYIDRFLSASAADVQGRVLEIADNSYTQKYGGDRVSRSDVLHAVEGNPNATFVADLTRADHIPSNIFDCIILTQTLQSIYDVRAALRTLHRILKPGGVLLSTFSGGICQISRYDMDRWGDYWRFTSLSAQRLFQEVFPKENLSIESYGNVLVAIAFLHGVAAEELQQEELDYRDQDYELLITVRAVK